VNEETREEIRIATRFVYDLQKLRIQHGNRNNPRAVLDATKRDWMIEAGEDLKKLEQRGFRHLGRLLKRTEIWNTWLGKQRGVGPAMGGVIVASIDITKCRTVSALWRYCGLAVVDGRAERRVRGQKAAFDPWLKAKMTTVLSGCLIKANSPWKKFYDQYKHRKQNQLVDVCAACAGEGRVEAEACVACRKPRGYRAPSCDCGSREFKKTPSASCRNCGGSGGPAPWGRSDAHRHTAACRYMVKMFLAELWARWRELEGLPTRSTYAEEYLGRKHHAA